MWGRDAETGIPEDGFAKSSGRGMEPSLPIWRFPSSGIIVSRRSMYRAVGIEGAESELHNTACYDRYGAILVLTMIYPKM